jgi:hypothetical protein
MRRPDPTPDDPRQSVLPGDCGAVRALEYAHPTFDLPQADPDDFELTPESGAGQTRSLFDLEGDETR